MEITQKGLSFSVIIVGDFVIFISLSSVDNFMTLVARPCSDLAHFLLRGGHRDGGLTTVIWTLEQAHLPRRLEVWVLMRAQLGQPSNHHCMGHEAAVYAGIFRQWFHKMITAKAGRAQAVVVICLKCNFTIRTAIGAIHVQKGLQGSTKFRFQHKIGWNGREEANNAITNYILTGKWEVSKKQ